MDWSKGFTSGFYMTIVDPVTWRDIERVEITKGSISKTDSGLRESADIDGASIDLSSEYWVRIWLNAIQSEDSMREPLFTGITSCPRKSINGLMTETPIECYSVLKPVEDVLLPRGYYVPVDIGGAETISKLLAPTYAPVSIDGESPKLKEAIIAENGETNLSMIEKILVAIDWQMRIAGDGTIMLSPTNNDSVMIIGTNYDVVEPEITVEQDWYSCPNVFRAVSDGLSSVARDDSETSKLSTVNRGREIWAEETSCSLNEGETIAQYSIRRLEELQTYGMTVSYSRRYIPDLYPEDIITMNYPSIDELSMEDFIISKQTITLDKGVRVSETISK